jgi:Co/Zn/Cd efflux system component
MSQHCDHDHTQGGHHHHEVTAEDAKNPKIRLILWIALISNAAMFFVEIAGGISSGSVSLLADSVDFAGDSVSYALSLAVLSMATIWGSRVAFLKGLCMGLFGVGVLLKTAYAYRAGIPPEPFTMGSIAVLAFFVNLGVALMLYTFRTGDANMRSVWLCSRNDSISNLAVFAAAWGVFGTQSVLPDLFVAALMALLAISSSVSVIRHSRQELAAQKVHSTHSH